MCDYLLQNFELNCWVEKHSKHSEVRFKASMKYKYDVCEG